MRAEKGAGSRFFDKTRQRYVFAQYFYSADGSKKRKTITAKKRKDLERKVREWKETLVDGRESFGQTMTVKDIYTVWISAIRTSVKESTWSLYCSSMRSHVLPVFGQRKPVTITAVEIQYWLNSLLTQPLSARTCNVVRSTWFTCFEWALGQGIIRQNPLRGVHSLRESPKPIKALNEEELDRLLAEAQEGKYYSFTDDEFGDYLRREVYVAVLLAARTGMRRGEVFGLQWSNVDFSTKTIHVANNLTPNKKITSPKTMNSARNVLLDSDTASLLEKWKIYQQRYMTEFSGIVHHEKDLVFTTQIGTPVGLDNFRTRQWKALTEAAGLPGIGFHSLRHTHATLLIAAGVPVKVVSERLGHKSVTLTMRVYVNVLPTMQQMAVEAIQKMNEKSSQKVLAHPLGAEESD